MASVVAAAKKETGAVGSKFTFVYLPVPLSWPIAQRNVSREAWEKAKREFAASSISIVDFGLSIGHHPDPSSLWMMPGGHYSPAGYGLLARSVTDAVSNNDY